MVWEPLKLLHLFSERFSKTKIILFDLDTTQFLETRYFLQQGNSFLILHEDRDQYPGYKNRLYFQNSIEDGFIYTGRCSLEEVKTILNRKRRMKKLYKHHIIKDMPINSSFIENKGYSVAVTHCTKEKLNNALEQRYTEHFNDLLLPSLWQLVEECKKRNILIIFNQVPTFEGRSFVTEYGTKCGIPPELCNTEIDHQFEKVCQELQKRDNVVFLGFRRFSDIGVMDDEEELFRDFHHLLPKGAEIYTKWLAEELMRNPKTRAALERE